MKKTFLFAASLIWLQAFAQNASIKVSYDQPDQNRKLSLSRPLQITQFPSVNDVTEITAVNGVYAVRVNIEQPEIMYLMSHKNDTLEFNQPIFLQPGYDIVLQAATANGKLQLTVTGKGAADNQPWQFNYNISFANYTKDTVPDRILADLKKQTNENWNAFSSYKASYHPSADFIQSWTMEIQYTAIRMYYVYAKQRKFDIKRAYYRNINKWDSALNEMLIKAPLMNEAAIHTSAYRLFLKMFLIFNKPHVTDGEDIRAVFVKNYYTEGKDTGTRSYTADENNIPNQKTIEKYFSGKTKEYLYAHLFKMALETGKLVNLDAIYTDFSKQYPGSAYTTLYGQQITAATESLKKNSNAKMIFESDNVQTWAGVLELFKGKTVLLDMWGTWCGPCRNEIEKNGPAVKKYFNNKGLDFLYIANYDQENVNAWKSLITYFNMEGHHILATKELTDDIAGNIKIEGYPTYVIIHKNGTYEVTKTRMGSPEEMKIMIAQIEDALHEK
jgi:thiol-disulfide isomerase/thioredoxin